MGKPSVVTVGGHRYDIKYRFGEVAYEDEDGEMQLSLGFVKLMLGRIEVATGRAASQMAETLLHEIVHAISYDRNIGLEERQVDQVAAGLMDVMQNNKHIFGTHFVDRFKE